ncbi:MAG: hypothetical protein WAM29_07150, partial [Methylocella sp.]
GFGGGHMTGVGGFNRGLGFNQGFVGRSVATGGFNRGFDHRSTRFDHFHHFHHRFGRFNRFSNFAFFPFFGDYGWDYGYPYADCGYWGSDYCGYGYPDYASSYPDYGYDNGYYGNGYDNGYASGYPATGSSGYYAAPLVTGRSVATGQQGSHCTVSVKACELHHPSYLGGACSCRVPGGRARGLVTR